MIGLLLGITNIGCKKWDSKACKSSPPGGRLFYGAIGAIEAKIQERRESVPLCDHYARGVGEVFRRCELEEIVFGGSLGGSEIGLSSRVSAGCGEGGKLRDEREA